MSSPGELKQLYLEGIGLAAAESMRGKILDLADEYAGEPCSFDDEQQFTVFVGGPLYHAVEDLVGGDAADAMMEFFEPLLRKWLLRSSSGAWRRRPDSPPADDRPAVVIAFADAEVGVQLVTAFWAASYTVHAVLDGKDALDRCRQHMPRAVVLDAALPGPVGADKLCKLLRLALRDAAPSVVLMGEAGAAPSPGAAVALPKGTQASQVVRTVDALLATA